MRFLEAELKTLPGADIRFGHEVTGVTQDGDAVTLTANTANGPAKITGRYVIAADGARSACAARSASSSTASPIRNCS